MSFKRPEGVLKAVKQVRGGVHVSHHKNTAEMEVVRMAPPSKIVLPMQQHIGAPCEPTVKVGDIVSVGQVVGDTDKFVSAPIHSSISGKVVAVGDVSLPSGVVTKGVTIESDGEMRQYEGITPPVIETREDFIKAVRASGLVGLGGAGFPTHVKLAFPKEKNIDTLVINAAECEPYITVDYRECLENSKNIIGGIQLFNRPNYDSSICVISTYRMDKEERAAFEQLMESICPADFNGDGETMVNIVDYQFYSEAEYEAEVDRYGAITNEEGQTEAFRINKDYNVKEFDGFIKYSMTGETSVCLVSTYVYEKLKEADRLKPLAEIYGEEAVPETAVDAYGIHFMQTDFYRYHPEVKMLPDNLILCVLRPSTITGRNKNETVYAHDLAFFRANADFTVSEDTAT